MLAKRDGETSLDKGIRINRVMAEKREQAGQQALDTGHLKEAAYNFNLAAQHWYRLGIISSEVADKARCMDNWIKFANRTAEIRATRRE
jgi:hypothetical protein